MVSLHNRLLELKQGHSQYGHNGLLFAMTLKEAEKIDSVAGSSSFVKDCRNDIIGLLRDYDVGYSEHLKTAFDTFSECSIYIQLKERGVVVKRVPEGRESQPDFEISYGSEKAYCEVKTLGWANGMHNYNVAGEDGINAKIAIEDQIQAGIKVPMATSGIAPFGQSEELSIHPGKVFTRKVIDKLRNNIKPTQFRLGPTFLICDLSLLYIPSPSASLASVIAYMAPESNSIVSGELWHVAFGKQNDQILKRIEFEGMSNTSGRLKRDGVLVDKHKNLKALIICTSPFDKAKKTFSVFAYSSDFEQFGEILYQISDFWNDETNSNAWEVVCR